MPHNVGISYCGSIIMKLNYTIQCTGCVNISHIDSLNILGLSVEVTILRKMPPKLSKRC